MNYLKLTNEKLSVEFLNDLVASPKCGAISLFVGITRDNFNNKTVISLEYEAYESMAIKVLEDLCCEMRNKWKTLENIAVYHRLGNVPIKEASVVIAVSSPHRAEAMEATEWCINNLKKSVPIWKKEIYDDGPSEWKENKEYEVSSMKKVKLVNIVQEVEAPYVAPHLIQIKATNEEITRRLETFMDRKRNEINISNIAEFCTGDRNTEFICARIDAKLKKCKNSKSHLQVDRVLNNFYHRDQMNSNYIKKYIPSNGIEERLQNLESQLSMSTCVSGNIYKRLQTLEERMMTLESISPEYIQFWEKVNNQSNLSAKKKVFSLDEIDSFISSLEKNSDSDNKHLDEGMTS